ncbi:MAG TPA: ferritin-like domain-containing protein [Acidimicrobiales bacterium]|jgi:rubrerythrin|nr:ferritin-like domain-containing protein [Acidimicrobiales bacterium]
MEISARELRSLATDVDAEHRDGMVSMASDLRELHAETRMLRTAATRRDLFKKAGVGAGVLTIGSVVMPFSRLLPVAAQELTDGDIAAFAESVELAAVEAYKAAADSGKLSAPVVEAGTMFARHHQEHAEAFGGAAGDKASGKPNPTLLQAVGGQLKGAANEKAILQIAYDLENAAASTYLFGLGALKSEAALKLAASILPVESQHAVVIGQVLGKPATDFVPAFENQDKALDPAKFPVK